MITRESFGNFNGKEVYKYLLKDEIEVSIISYGAMVSNILVPDSNGKLIDIALGFDNKANYVYATDYIGATIGRTANRIYGAKFNINGKEYKLTANDHDVNCHHGGPGGFNTKVFDSKVISNNRVEFSYYSKDLEEGYPGNLMFTVGYEVKGKELIIDFTASADEDTLCGPTSHIYFNLNGESDGCIDDNFLFINSSKFLPLNKYFVPSGEIRNVADTPFDFTSFVKIGNRVENNDEQLNLAGGYDHNYCLEDEYAASVYSTKTNIRLDIFTDLPGIQFYSGNFLSGNVGKSKYNKRSGFALEPQFYPNSINNNCGIKPILRKGETFRKYIRYVFSNL